jgi:hypothetical protein
MIWLHIGMPKTGSSAIQAWLREHRKALSEAGVFYAPDPKEEEGPAWSITSGNAVRLGRQLSEPVEPVYAEDPIATFAERFASPGHPTSIVSSEILAGALPDRLARLGEALKGKDIRVLALVRDHYGHAFSLWHQVIKRSGWSGSFADFVRKHYNDPQSRVLRVFEGVFGPEAITLIHYDEVADRLIPAVLGAMGIQPPADAAAPVVNRSLTPVEAEVLAECNRLHGGSQQISRRLSDHLLYKHPERATRPELDEEAAALIAERGEGGVRAINERWFGGKPVLSAKPPAPRDLAEDGSADAVWRDVVEALMAWNGELNAENRELNLTNLVLKARDRFRKGETEAGNALLQRALAIDPEHAQAKAMAARAKAGAFAQ